MSKKSLNLEDLFAALGPEMGKTAGVVKTASNTPSTPSGLGDIEKLAGELQTAGKIFADGFVGRTLEKIAETVPAAGGGAEPRSAFQQVAKKLAVQKGQNLKPGDDTETRAEESPKTMAGSKAPVNKHVALS